MSHCTTAKTDDRDRTVPLTDRLCRELLILARDKGPDDPIFEMEYRQLDCRWRRIRKHAELQYVRFKDLRAQVSRYGEAAGVPLMIVQKTYGHNDEAVTRRYQKRKAVMSTEQAEAIESAMFPAEETCYSVYAGWGSSPQDPKAIGF